MEIDGGGKGSRGVHGMDCLMIALEAFCNVQGLAQNTCALVFLMAIHCGSFHHPSCLLPWDPLIL